MPENSDQDAEALGFQTQKPTTYYLLPTNYQLTTNY